jgi:hypothetical protein
MSTELFNIDIFNEILSANMLSYYGLGEEFSIKVKDNLSKHTVMVKKVTLIEDKSAQEKGQYFNIFDMHKIEGSKPRHKDTKIFTEPKLNYSAQMQLSEYYMVLFYLKGGFSNYHTYDDLIEDQLIGFESDSDDDLISDREMDVAKSIKRFTFSRQPSDKEKR